MATQQCLIYKKGNNIMDIKKLDLTANVGHRTPFKVPEGYFDDFTNQMMAQIEEEHAPALKVVGMSAWARARRRIAACACVALVAGAALYAGLSGKKTQASASIASSAAEAAYTYSSFDAAADYSMLDSDDMYAMMAMSN